MNDKKQKVLQKFLSSPNDVMTMSKDRMKTMEMLATKIIDSKDKGQKKPNTVIIKEIFQNELYPEQSSKKKNKSISVYDEIFVRDKNNKISLERMRKMAGILDHVSKHVDNRKESITDSDSTDSSRSSDDNKKFAMTSRAIGSVGNLVDDTVNLLRFDRNTLSTENKKKKKTSSRQKTLSKPQFNEEIKEYITEEPIEQSLHEQDQRQSENEIVSENIREMSISSTREPRYSLQSRDSYKPMDYRQESIVSTREPRYSRQMSLQARDSYNPIYEQIIEEEPKNVRQELYEQGEDIDSFEQESIISTKVPRYNKQQSFQSQDSYKQIYEQEDDIDSVEQETITKTRMPRHRRQQNAPWEELYKQGEDIDSFSQESIILTKMLPHNRQRSLQSIDSYKQGESIVEQELITSTKVPRHSRQQSGLWQELYIPIIEEDTDSVRRELHKPIYEQGEDINSVRQELITTNKMPLLHNRQQNALCEELCNKQTIEEESKNIRRELYKPIYEQKEDIDSVGQKPIITTKMPRHNLQARDSYKEIYEQTIKEEPTSLKQELFPEREPRLSIYQTSYGPKLYQTMKEQIKVVPENVEKIKTPILEDRKNLISNETKNDSKSDLRNLNSSKKNPYEMRNSKNLDKSTLNSNLDEQTTPKPSPKNVDDLLRESFRDVSDKMKIMKSKFTNEPINYDESSSQLDTDVEYDQSDSDHTSTNVGSRRISTPEKEFMAKHKHRDSSVQTSEDYLENDISISEINEYDQKSTRIPVKCFKKYMVKPVILDKYYTDQFKNQSEVINTRNKKSPIVRVRLPKVDVCFADICFKK